MKRALYFLALSTLLLVGCQNEAAPTRQVALDLGTMIETSKDDAVSGTSQLRKITYSQLNSLIRDEANFLFLVKGSENTCLCWQEFHQNCLAPYAKAKHVLIYYMDLEAFEKEEDHYGLKLYASYDTLGIFEKGKLAYSQSTAKDKGWGTDYVKFHSWMDARLTMPRIFYVNQTQLDNLYLGIDPEGNATSRFALYFGRDTCPDCSYLLNHDLKDYFANRKSVSEPLYYFDADVWRGKDDYQDKKDAYGLSQSEDNPYGYASGAFPTIMSIIPSEGEKIDTIDQMGVFYNERIVDGTISNSYFTEERIADLEAGLEGALSYAEAVSPNVLEGLEADASNKYESLSHYEKPLVFALLDAII